MSARHMAQGTRPKETARLNPHAKHPAAVEPKMPMPGLLKLIVALIALNLIACATSIALCVLQGEAAATLPDAIVGCVLDLGLLVGVIRRQPNARTMGVTLLAMSITFSVASYAGTASPNLLEIVGANIPDLLLLLYFATSTKFKMYLGIIPSTYRVDGRGLRISPKTGRPYTPGILKAFCVYLTLGSFFLLMTLVATSRDIVSYSPTLLLRFADLVFTALFLWMTVRRLRVGRAWIVFFTLFNMGVGTLGLFVTGELEPITQAVSMVPDALLLAYALFSRKLRGFYTEDFTLELDRELSEDSSDPWHYKISRRGWPFVRNLAIYYCVFSLMGHWMECAFCTLIRLGLVHGDFDPSNTMLWRDWFYPFPMEGLAVVGIALVLHPLWQWLRQHIRNNVPVYLLSFLANMAFCTAIEYVMGQFVNADLQLWNYSDMPFNFQGMICLQNAVGFGLVASLIAWIVYPVMEWYIARIPRNVMSVAFVAILAAYAIPQTLYLTDPPVPAEVSLRQILDDPDSTDEERAEAQRDLDKLGELERQKEEAHAQIEAQKAAEKGAGNQP